MTVAAIAARTQGAKTFLARHDHRLLIGENWLAAASGETIAVIDPASDAVLGSIPRGREADIDAAVEAARMSFASGVWRNRTPAARAQVLNRIADLLEANIDALAELETLDQGKPLAVARWAEIPGSIGQFRYFAGAAAKLEGATIPTGIDYQPKGKHIFAYTLREPLGVVAAIVP